MYQPDSTTLVTPRIGGNARRVWQPVPRTVWYLGITSLLTDLSSEMVTSVLPLFLVVQLNVSPFAFGALDGLYNGVTALTRWGGGIAADRWRRRKSEAELAEKETLNPTPPAEVMQQLEERHTVR